MGDTQGAMSPRPLAAQRDEPRIPRRDVEIPTTPDDGAHHDPLTDERLEARLAEACRRGEQEVGTTTLLVPSLRVTPRRGGLEPVAARPASEVRPGPRGG
jgi:hypothetical protein